MKIAINCIFFQPKGGGIKEYIYNLTNNIALIDNKNSYILYVLEDQIDYASRYLPSSMKIKTVPYKSGKLSVIQRSIFERNFWLTEEKIERFDIFHSPFFHAPKFKYAKVILTVHDLRFYRYPKTYAILRYLYLKRKVKDSIKSADAIIAISEFTKREIIDAYNIEENKITVILEGINRDRYTLKTSETPLQIPKDLENNKFILSVGHLEPRKNYEALIKSFLMLKTTKSDFDYKLVIVGKKGHHYQEVLKLVDSSNDIIYLNFVDHSTLLWLYKQASIFVFPSYYEGFGFPPLEAACFGTLSVVSNISSIPEVCGNSAIYFNPFDINDMADKIYIALNDASIYNKIRQNLIKNLERFSWKENAESTIKIYNSFESGISSYRKNS